MLKPQSEEEELGIAFKQSEGRGHALNQNSLSVSR